MTLRAVVLLAAIAALAYRFFPRRRISWALPLVLGATILLVRGVAWWLSQP